MVLTDFWKGTTKKRIEKYVIEIIPIQRKNKKIQGFSFQYSYFQMEEVKNSLPPPKKKIMNKKSYNFDLIIYFVFK